MESVTQCIFFHHNDIGIKFVLGSNNAVAKNWKFHQTILVHRFKIWKQYDEIIWILKHGNNVPYKSICPFVIMNSTFTILGEWT